ncbi:hypothetical protein HWV62_12881 [Athelia sp. TMB]|nr:hypothetical protein HWV62_12881 [Athelia sp. TMB]
MASDRSSNHNRSISDCTHVEQAVVMSSLEKIEGIMFEPGDGNAALRKLGVFLRLQEDVAETKKALKWLQSQRKETDGREAYARSFSEVTQEEHLEQLGVVGGHQTSSIQQAEFDQSVDDALETQSLKKHKTSLAQWNPQELKETINLIDNQFSQRTEAAARIRIDQWLLSLLKLCSGPDLRLTVGVVPEIVISRSSGRAVVIKSGKNYTRLTGSTDYAIFSLDDTAMPVNMYLAHHYDQARQEVAAAPVLFMEAKNEKANFDECVRQVIAQSVVGLAVNLEELPNGDSDAQYVQLSHIALPFT